jgi:peptidyl-prolyl cis-trans isomerase D
MGDEFDAVAFTLTPGEISDIVESPLGFHIIKVEEKIDAHTKDLEDVHAEIEPVVKREAAREMARAQANAGYNKAMQGEALADLAAAGGFDRLTPEPFAANEEISGLGRNSALSGAAFTVEQGKVGPVVTSGDEYFVFRVVEKIASRVPELDEVRERVGDAVRQEQAAGLAKTKAEEALAKLKASADIDAVAQEYGVSVQESGEFSHPGGYISGIGNAPDLKRDAFALTKEAPVAPKVYAVGSASYIATLKERIPIDAQKFAEEKDKLIEQLERQQETQAVEQFVEYLEAHASIEKNEDYLASIQDTGRPLMDPRL